VERVVSAFAALTAFVEEALARVTEALSSKDTEQEVRLDDLERRVSALEAGKTEGAPAARKTASARTTKT